MPISEKDIFASLMKDPNHAYNPIEKVWAEAQQRARQFRNNEKALSLAFDTSPALEKLFEFVQKADEDEGDTPQNRLAMLEANIPSYLDFIRRINAFNAAKMSYGEDEEGVPQIPEHVIQNIMQNNSIRHDWAGGRAPRDSSLESSLNALNTSATILGDLRNLIIHLRANPEATFEAALDRSPNLKQFMESGLIRPNGTISPILTQGLNKFLAHDEIKQILPPETSEVPDDPIVDGPVEDTSGADSSVEDETPLEGLIEDGPTSDATPEVETPSEEESPIEEEAPTPEVRTSPFELNELNELIRANAGSTASINLLPQGGWQTNPKLMAPQLRTLTRLGMINQGGAVDNYEWSEAGAPWKSLLDNAVRTQARNGRDIQPLNANVFQAMLAAHNGSYLAGHVPDTAVNEQLNQNVDPTGTVVETLDGPAVVAAPEPTTPTVEDIPHMTPEGWEAYMSEYPHKEGDRYIPDSNETYAEAEEAGRTDIRSLLLPRELGSWEDGTFVQGAPIDPLHNAEGTDLRDMSPEESQAHLHEMFDRLLKVFHDSNHKDHPDSTPRRFGTYLADNQAMQADMWRNEHPNVEPTAEDLQELVATHPYYYKIDINNDNFDKNAYNSYLENTGVLERWLQKYGELIGIKTSRQEMTRPTDADKQAAIVNYNDGGEDSEGEGVVNPRTGELYTMAELDSFTADDSWPDDLRVGEPRLTITRNRHLDRNHPAASGGIYEPAGDDLYIHPQAWEWTDALYSLGLVDPETGYPGFHMLSRTDYDLQGGHGLDYNNIHRGATTIQGMLNARELPDIDGVPQTEHLWDTVLPQEKDTFQQRHPGAKPGAFNKAFDDYQRYLGNPTPPGDPARVLSEVDPSEEEQEIAARRGTAPSFEEWTQNFLNGDYQDVLGDVWPENLTDAEGLGPNGLQRMHLYKEEDARQEGHRQPHAVRSDRMERWGFSDDAMGAARRAEAEGGGQAEGGAPAGETAGEGTAVAGADPAAGTTTTDTTTTGEADLPPPAFSGWQANHRWVWTANEDNPLEGDWEWKEPSREESLLGGTELLQTGNQFKKPDVPKTISTRNNQIHDILEQEFGKDYEEKAQNDPGLKAEIDGEIGSMIRHHGNNRLENEHEKRVIIARRTARLKANAEEAKSTKGLTDADKPIAPDELERMMTAYKAAVKNMGADTEMDKDYENWLRGHAASNPKQFRNDYGAALKLNAKHVSDSAKRQLQVDANDIDGYRGILPLQQMPTQDDVITQIRRLEYWKNKHGEHMTDSTRKTWNQRWQEITQASANIPDFDIDEFIAEDKKNAQEANLEYGGEDHLKEAGKAHVTDISTNAKYMQAVGEGAALRSNRNHKPWLVIKYDSNGAGTLHDLRQRDEVTGEWGKPIHPDSLAFDEDTHYFDYNETPGNQPQQSAAESFWSKVDRYSNFRPLDHRGALERFDNDDTKFAKTKNLLGEQGVQHGWFHPESGAWINPHRYNDVREELANAGPGSGMMIPAGEHYHGSHRPNGQGEPNPRYAFARRGKAKMAQMNNNNDLSYYVDSQGNINHADAEWSAVQQKDKTQPQTVNDVIHDYHSQQFYNYFTQTADSFKDSEGNFLTGKVLRPQNPPQTPPQQPLQMHLLKEVFEGDALERRRKQGYAGKPQTGSKDLQSDELGHSGEFWGRQQEYRQRYQDVLNYPGSGLLGWIGGIINPFAVASDVGAGGIGRGVKGVVSRALGAKDPSFEAIRRIRRQYRVDAEAEQRTKDVMDKLEVHGHPMRYLSPGESKSRAEDLKELRTHVGKRVKWHQQEAAKMATARARQGTGAPKSQQHQDHDDENLKFQGITNQLNGLNSELDSDWYHINNLYDQYMGNQQVQNKFAPHPSEGDGGWASRFENPPQNYQPSQGGQQASGGLSGLIGDDSPQRSQLQGLIGGNSGSSQRNELQGLIA